ncbi:hypothetical protein ACT8ZV_17660 [Nocardioides sp. MAHUQ-72]|uniref:hypothetical protein n=1 Tax=unclassified Nocardioides TaxID=2615069 RepID=UPI003616C78A
MRALLRVELTRLRWRRAVLLLVAACVVVPAVIWGATAWNTRPVSDAEMARYQQMAQDEAQQPYVQRQVEKCVARPDRFGVSGDDVRASCEDMMVPRADQYYWRPTLDLDRELDGSGIGVTVVLTMLLLLLGTTFVGHDWNSGSMSNQLLFDPRRSRVWVAKGLVVLLAGLAVAGAVLAAYWTGLWALAVHRDLDVRDGVLSEAYGQALRGTLVAGFAGLGGYAMTMLFRSTVATLGTLFAVAVAGPLLITLLGFPGHQRLMPQNNYAAVMLDGITFTDYNSRSCVEAGDSAVPGAGCRVRITTSDGAVYFGGLLLLAGVPSVLSFRRRDVP